MRHFSFIASRRSNDRSAASLSDFRAHPDYARLPSQQRQLLAKAIDRRLLEVERRFWSLNDDPRRDFVARGGAPRDFFGLGCPAPAQFRFEGDVLHSFVPEPEWFSLLVSADGLAEDDGSWMGRLFRLSEDPHPTPIHACLGQRCVDVRVWSLREGERNEPQEAAVSYLFDGGAELFYATWLHGEDDSDQLFLRDDGPRTLNGAGSEKCATSLREQRASTKFDVPS
jgi:hypothetical protein